MRLKIQGKILFFILITTILIFIVVIGLISVKAKKDSFSDAQIITDSYAKEYANLVSKELNIDVGIARSLATNFIKYKPDKKHEDEHFYNSALYYTLDKNKEYLSAWINWEIFPEENSSLEREIILKSYYRNKNKIKYRNFRKKGEMKESSFYAELLKYKSEIMTNPYLFSQGGKGEQVMKTSICVPIIRKQVLHGIAGLDIPLSKFQKITDAIKPFDKSYAFLIANNGKFVTYPYKQMLNKSIAKLFPKEYRLHNIGRKLMKGEHFSFLLSTNRGTQFYLSFAPVKVGEVKKHWFIGIVVPVEIMNLKANNTFFTSIVVAFIGLIIISLMVWFIAKNITSPIVVITNILRRLSKGKVQNLEKLEIKTKDEIGEMQDSLNKLIEGLKSTAVFAERIGEGNLDAKFSTLSLDDGLGNSLLEMRKRLNQAKKEEEKRKIENEQQNWDNKGVAKFAEILRQNNDNMEEFTYEIISNLVRYLSASQGGLFLINEEQKIIEQKASYAFETKKLVDKKMELKNGLLGRCIQENKTIYMTDIPQNYINITSGLGEANPTSLLIVPLVFNEVTYGVVELASFKEFEPYQIEFIEKIGHSIASTISTVKINIQTNELLSESKKQSEELAQKEYEMRETMEAMREAQGEAALREQEMKGLWGALNSTALVVELDMDGTILNMNQKSQQAVGLTDKYLIGKKHKDLAFEAKNSPKKYEEFWNNLRKGKMQERTLQVNIGGREVWISETYTPIRNREGIPYRILNIGIDITQQKKKEIELSNRITELEEIKVEQ